MLSSGIVLLSLAPLRQSMVLQCTVAAKLSMVLLSAVVAMQSIGLYCCGRVR